ncbi:efflux transporter outer membrane subunit [Novosphingobium sp.]|uniref:efflux transporter outer membrane subunit n=1 Tax=Novosphingobium sp. TaxID=1874826 RepID=UPI003D0F6129
MRSKHLIIAAPLVLGVMLGGCALTPRDLPVVAPPPHFDDIPPNWAEAVPADTIPRGPWWYAFNDAVLNDLEMRADAASPTLAAALARRDEARAVLGETRADLVPEVDAVGSAERQRVAKDRPQSQGYAVTGNNYVLGAQLNYEVDLWGRVRNEVRAARSEERATEADLASVKLSLQASVADAYVRLRGLDAEQDLLVRSVDAFTKAYNLTRTRHIGGVGTALDENRALTVLGNARALSVDVTDQRNRTEHELAALVGALSSGFKVAPVGQVTQAPAVPVSTPSTLLQRRPDIAAAERRVAESNARIGAAHAALFPTITLGLAGGFNTTGPALLSQQNTTWALGPLGFNLPIFDGGRRLSAVRLARAQFDENAANYRNTVITAFREVEDSLTDARDLAREVTEQQIAVKAAQATTKLSLIRYREGASNYLEVVTAQTDELNSERSLLAVQTRVSQASVSIVRALGGPVNERPAGS